MPLLRCAACEGYSDAVPGLLHASDCAFQFKKGDRVSIDPYGAGTVEVVWDGLVGVIADIGQIWFRRPEEVNVLIEVPQ